MKSERGSNCRREAVYEEREDLTVDERQSMKRGGEVLTVEERQSMKREAQTVDL